MMMMSPWRWTMWVALLILSVVRPGIDALDRWLVGACWNIPSEWNAVADIAIKTGAIDSTIDGASAPWRQASVMPLGAGRIAVVTVSDFHRSRAAFLTERYELLAAFERTTTNPALVTDETRGYKPLTHIWPLVEEEGRILTLVTTVPLLSEPPTLGTFAYLAVGRDDSELLFVCELRWAPGPRHAQLARVNQSARDLALYPEGKLDAAPVATFQWNPASREYTGRLSDESSTFISWWGTTPANRVIIKSGESVDDAIAAVAAGLSASSRPAGGAGGN
jgi:hypothetical protein